MIRRLVAALGALIVYFCMATVISLSIGVFWLWQKGMLTEDKLAKTMAILHGIDLAAIEERLDPGEPPGEEQVSIEQIAEARAVKFRFLEMREQAIRQDIAQLSYLRSQFEEDQQHYASLRESFDDRLQLLRDGVIAQAEENVRLIFENIKPRQAKDQILEMLDHGEIGQVVSLLSAMPVSKRAKIAGEFRSPDEEAKLAEILRQMRLGIPDITLIDQTLGELRSQTPES